MVTEERGVDELENLFKRYGFETFREVIPDQCKDWEKPYRADLIVKYGKVFIGIEGKKFNSFRQGGKIAKTIEQINKYKKLTYFDGQSIERWAIFPILNDNDYEKDTSGFHSTSIFVSTFIKYLYGLDMIRMRGDSLSIGEGSKDSITMSKWRFKLVEEIIYDKYK